MIVTQFNLTQLREQAALIAFLRQQQEINRNKQKGT